MPTKTGTRPVYVIIKISTRCRLNDYTIWDFEFIFFRRAQFERVSSEVPRKIEKRTGKMGGGFARRVVTQTAVFAKHQSIWIMNVSLLLFVSLFSSVHFADFAIKGF